MGNGAPWHGLFSGFKHGVFDLIQTRKAASFPGTIMHYVSLPYQILIICPNKHIIFTQVIKIHNIACTVLSQWVCGTRCSQICPQDSSMECSTCYRSVLATLSPAVSLCNIPADTDTCFELHRNKIPGKIRNLKPYRSLEHNILYNHIIINPAQKKWRNFISHKVFRGTSNCGEVISKVNCGLSILT